MPMNEGNPNKEKALIEYALRNDEFGFGRSCRASSVAPAGLRQIQARTSSAKIPPKTSHPHHLLAVDQMSKSRPTQSICVWKSQFAPVARA